MPGPNKILRHMNQLFIHGLLTTVHSLITAVLCQCFVSVLQYLTGPRFTCPYKIHFDGFQHRLTFAVNKKFLIFNF